MSYASFSELMVNSLYMDLVMIASVVIRGKGHPLQI